MAKALQPHVGSTNVFNENNFLKSKILTIDPMTTENGQNSAMML